MPVTSLFVIQDLTRKRPGKNILSAIQRCPPFRVSVNWRFYCILKKFIGNMRNLVLNNLWKLQVKKLHRLSSIYCRISRKIWRKSRFKYFHLGNLGKKGLSLPKFLLFLHDSKSWSYQVFKVTLITNGEPCQISSKL